MCKDKIGPFYLVSWQVLTLYASHALTLKSLLCYTHYAAGEESDEWIHSFV